MITLGIDLGTSNSAAALLFSRKEEEARMVRPTEGLSYDAKVYPSYIAFDSNGDLETVGLHAKERYRDGATDLVVCNFKRLIGRSYDYVAREISKGSRYFKGFKGRIERGPTGEVLIRVGEKKYSIIEISSFLLKRIVAEAESEAQRVGGESIEKMVISIPAGFDGLQREATFAAAKAAGLANVKVIKVIEEPTAAVIVKGIEGQKGKIIVIDVGAGTTDIVVGYIAESKGERDLEMANRQCDDELGGIDMDYCILEYLFEEDKTQPRLKDVYPTILDNAEKGRLMAKIEEAKISASRDGSGQIAITLRIDDKPKRINVPLDENTLNKIVHKLVWGYQQDGKLKGIKPIVEKALLSVAGDDPQKVTKVKQEIENIILVGGPCRMRCIHGMLQEVFKENETVCKQIDMIDPLSPFPMEAVARGAAESVKFRGITTETPYNISIFHWAKGQTPVIAKGESYIREEGVTESAQVPVHRGGNTLHILTEKGPKYDWPMKDHLVSVPQEGLLKITLHWSETGMENTKANKIQGAGILEPIALPQINDRKTLGDELQKAFKDYFEEGVFILRQRIKDAREPIRRRIFKGVAKVNPQLFQLLQVSPDLVLDQYSIEGVPLRSYIEKLINDMLAISEEDLRKCETIEGLDTLFVLTEEEIEVALRDGYYEARDENWAPSRGIPKRAIEVLRNIPWGPESVPVDILISVAEGSLSTGRQHATCSKFAQPLDKWLNKFKEDTNNPAIGCMVANCLGALADCLYNSGLIDKQTFNVAKNIAYAFSPEDC